MRELLYRKKETNRHLRPKQVLLEFRGEEKIRQGAEIGKERFSPEQELKLMS